MSYSPLNASQRTSLLRLTVSVVLLNVLVPVNTVFACGGAFDVRCNLAHGGLSPQNLINQGAHAAQDAANTAAKAAQDTANATAKAGQDVANALNEIQANLITGPILEQAIVESHNTAISGSMPIPLQMRQMLTGYASDDSMDRVRYKIGDSGFANLAHLLEQGGAASAVTLIDVIVFRDSESANNPKIWAHELTHVDQYQDGGVQSFAVRYVRNWQSIENPAYAKEDGFWAWYNQTHSAPGLAPPIPAPSPVQIANPFPQTVPIQNLGAFCWVQGHRFGPGFIQPLGNSCFVDLPQGRFFGQVGP
jgi:hypothetical protein